MLETLGELETLGKLVSADFSPVARLDTLKRVTHFYSSLPNSIFDLQASHNVCLFLLLDFIV